MIIQKISVTLTTGFAGATHRDTLDVEIPDNASEKEIEEIKDEACREWAFNFVEFSWSDKN
jgi:hypothetical protein